MIGMIGRLVQVSPMRGRICLFLHVLGLVAGAAALGAVLGLITAGLRWAGIGVFASLLPRGSGEFALGLLALLCGLRGLGVLRFPLLQRRRQVPRSWWYRMGTMRASFAWGLVIGPGLFTVIEYPIYYVLLALALVLPAAQSVLLLAMYGLGQGLALLARTPPAGVGVPAVIASDPTWRRLQRSLASGAALTFAAYLFSSTWMVGPMGF